MSMESAVPPSELMFTFELAFTVVVTVDDGPMVTSVVASTVVVTVVEVPMLTFPLTPPAPNDPPRT